ncbi:MAG: patatin-like phospholipase family protein [Actinomycetota bacterium]|nr:patatin-like phospholipase family protein [Actinomycetota bacterium]
MSSSTTDDLAQPYSFDARYGAGHRRTISLGGGGLFFVAWQISYLNGLAARGVQLDDAEIVVGTSAGSLVAGILTAGRLHRFGVRVDLLAKLPALISALAPVRDLHPSQERARDRFGAATDAEPDTVCAIGHAALAAQALPAAQLTRSTSLVMGVRAWRSASLQITTTDTYTGERLILHGGHGLTVPHAAAASASVPGLFSPQLIGDRRCMDGGVSGSGTHCDRLAGAERALVVSLVGGETTHPAGMTMTKDRQFEEVEELRATGTQVHLTGPSGITVEQLMDPASIGTALELGAHQAELDAPGLLEFWAD